MMLTGAKFNEGRTHRLELTRIWDGRPLCVFIGLNPSTADEKEDDPTIRRCIGFAEDWGCGGLVMLNLFAFRSTDPAGLRGHHPTEEGNWEHVVSRIASADVGKVIVAWGVHGAKHQFKFKWVMENRLTSEELAKIHHLGLTKGGCPKHPLYLRADTKPQRWIEKESTNG